MTQINTIKAVSHFLNSNHATKLQYSKLYGNIIKIDIWTNGMEV